MFGAKTWKPVFAFILTLLVFPESGLCDVPQLSPLISEMIFKCFNDPDSGYADKKITAVRIWMSSLQKPIAKENVANSVELSGFESVKFKWKLIDSPKNEWHDDMATFYILIQHGQIKFSKGYKPTTCVYTKVINNPTAPAKNKYALPPDKPHHAPHINAEE